jgi:predicted HicB family RNase H-like nuclease
MLTNKSSTHIKTSKFVGSNYMLYKGYIGKIEYDNKENIFHGEVITLRDVITFQGASVKELQKALQDSVEDYLMFCAERGENPGKPFSGKFIVRVSPELHRELSVRAAKEDTSINKLVNRALEITYNYIDV